GDDVGDGPAELEVGKAREQMTEHDAELASGQVGSEAEVRAAAAEGHVEVGLAPDVELLGIVERPGIAVGGGKEQGHPVTGLDGLPPELVVARRGPEVAG